MRFIRSSIYRFKDAVVRYFRKGRFRFETKSTHGHFNLVGPITLINKNIKLGNNVTIYPYCMFFGNGPIVIGDNVDIGAHTVIYSSKEGGVKIGDDTQIAAQCYLIDMDHGIAAGKRITEQTNSVAPIVIGKDCWLAANVTVLKGSVIEDGAVIGAKSLVKGVVKENTVNVGIPCKPIKKRE